MENATKALLIAAAVLIAILIISFGVFIINSVKDTITGSVDMSELEIQQFNQTYLNYNGVSVSGSRVKSLIDTVNTHNMTESEDSKKITLVTDEAGTTALDTSTIESGYRYTVKCIKDEKSALVTKIQITKNQ